MSLLHQNVVVKNRKFWIILICFGTLSFNFSRIRQLMPYEEYGGDVDNNNDSVRRTNVTRSSMTIIPTKTTNETTTIILKDEHMQHDEETVNVLTTTPESNSTIERIELIESSNHINNTVMNTSLHSQFPSKTPSTLTSSTPSKLRSSSTPSKLPITVPTSKPSNSPIEFVEGTVDKILRDHPHRGATDEYGRYGYIANVTDLRQWMLQKHCTISSLLDNKTVAADPSTVTITNATMNNTFLSCRIPFPNTAEMGGICNAEPKKGVEGDGWDIMKDIVNVPVEDSMLLINPNAPKILCSIYTHEKKEYLIRPVAETWGWRCDGFFASSTKTKTGTLFNMSEQMGYTGQSVDPNYVPPPVEMINLLHEGEEKYDNMWQKTRSMLSYMYDHYLNDYDYFFLSGDDTHLIVENLKRFLIQYEHNETIKWNQYGSLLSQPDVMFFTGQIISTSRVYMCGGGGYIMSRLALKHFVEDAMPHCHPHTIVSAEDRFLSNCLTDYLNVTLLDAADDNGKQRFHSTNPSWIATGRSESGFFTNSKVHWTSIHGNKSRAELVSPSSISFHHLRNSEMMKRHHIMLYYNGNHSHYRYDHNNMNNSNETGSCPVDSVLYKALAS